MTEHVPWLYTAERLKNGGRYAIVLGMVCGVLQLVSFDLFDQSNWGANLLMEHVQLETPMLMIIVLTLVRTVLAARNGNSRFSRTRRNLRLLGEWTASLGTASASATAGFAIIMVVAGAVAKAPLFLLACLYMVGIAELAIHVGQERANSKAMPYLLGILIAAPFSAGSL